MEIGTRVEVPFRQIVWLQPYGKSLVRQYRNGGGNALNVTNAMYGGVMGMSGLTYILGANDGTITPNGGVTDIGQMYIGGLIMRVFFRIH